MADNFPLKFLLATFAGWINRHQGKAIEYLVEENGRRYYTWAELLRRVSCIEVMTCPQRITHYVRVSSTR